MRNRFLAIVIVSALLLSACGRSVPVPTPGPTAAPALELVPFTQPGFGMRGLVPKGWSEVLPGMFAESSSGSGIPGIYLGFYEGMSRTADAMRPFPAQ